MTPDTGACAAPLGRFNPHPGFLPGGTVSVPCDFKAKLNQFQPTPGIPPGWNRLRSRRWSRHEDVSTHTRDSSRVEPKNRAVRGILSLFQPTPGIPPGWNPLRQGGIDGQLVVSTHTRDSSRVEPRCARSSSAELDLVSTHTRDSSRVEQSTHCPVLPTCTTFQPTPGIPPGWNVEPAASEAASAAASFNPHPGFLPGGTGDRGRRDDEADLAVSTHTRDSSRVELPVGAGEVLAPGVSTHTRDSSRVEPALTQGSASFSGFQPTPGIPPGWNRGVHPYRDPAPVSTHTRDSSRVERSGRSCRPCAPRSCFNPHPGFLPGGTVRSVIVSMSASSFQPTPGISSRVELEEAFARLKLA